MVRSESSRGLNDEGKKEREREGGRGGKDREVQKVVQE